MHCPAIISDYGRKLLLFVFVMLTLATSSTQAQYCPTGCSCLQRTVRCIRARLSQVPANIPTDTTVLDLRFNHLEQIPADAFRGLRQVTTLFLNENNIALLTDDSLRGLSALRFLYLSNNRLSQLPGNLLQYSPLLEAIYLENNQISQMHENVFKNLPRLNRITMFNNKLVKIPPNAFNGLTGLKRLRIDSNPIDCDCGVYSLWRHYQQHPQRHQIVINLSCEGPPALHRYGFVNLQERFFHCRKPEIVEAPHDLHVTTGASAELPCYMLGDPAPEILWLHNTNEISRQHDSDAIEAFNVNRMQILPSGSLRIHAVDGSDVGIYECIGRNAVGETKTQPIRLMVEPLANVQSQQLRQLPLTLPPPAGRQPDGNANVNYNGNSDIRQAAPAAPRFTYTPSNEIVGLKGATVLDCMASGNPMPEIQWFFNGRLIAQSTDNMRLEANGSLVLLQATLQMAGTYRCEANNPLGQIQATVRIDVREMPEILIAPQNQTITVGKPIVLECDADGNPLPTIKWLHNGIAIEASNGGSAAAAAEHNDEQDDEDDDGFVNNRRKHITLENENTELIIKAAQETDSGIYTCIAENENGKTTASASIAVERSHSPPRLLIEPYDLEALEGTTFELPCKAENAEEIVQITWRHDGRLIDPNAQQVEKYKISGTGSLFVKSASVLDSGRYECLLRNNFGRASGSALVTIKSNIDLAPGDKYVRIAFEEAAREIDLAINNTIDTLFASPNDEQRRASNNTAPNFANLLKVFRFPTGEARQLARAAEIYERTLVNVRKHVLKGDNLTIESDQYQFKDLLSRDHLHLVAELSGCMEHREMPNCTDMCFHSHYRSIDGTCNNLQHPTWGASLIAFRRIEKPIYENGISMPIGWTKDKMYAGFAKPSARLVSTTVVATEEITPDNSITHMVMQWGQFLDHDMDHAIPSVSSESWDGIDCKKTCEFAPPCYPIEVPPNDPRIKNRRCIDLVRSSSICGSGMTSVFFDSVQHREQINQLTSYIDASQVYGFSFEFSQELRNLTSDEGLLRVGVHFPKQKDMLPFAAPQDGMDCRRNLDENNMNCFVSGDIRVNEQIGLLAMHTIWMREHNRIARKLAEINPHWNGDNLFQEARKIVGAQMQHITYKHWLPLVIGPSGMEMLGEYKGYNPQVEPTIANEFATAAFRFGHTLINPILHRLDKNYEPIRQGHLPLHKAFFAPWRLAYEGGVDPLMRGLFTVPAKLKTPNQNLNTELTEKLFQTAHAVALDLAAINIQRGRDHGIPGYNAYRKFCNMTVASSFEDLSKEIISEEMRNKLKELYGHPDNIDVWVGGVLEEQVEGGKMGPLFQCLLVEQFRRLRDGDRFYYENPTVFEPQQLMQIKQSNLGRVLCDVGDQIEEITDNVFMLPTVQGGYKKCEEIPGINLYLWQDCGICNSRPPLFDSYVPETYVKRQQNRNKRAILSSHTSTEPNAAEEEISLDQVEQLFDVNEERVSGLEEVIGSFQKELKKVHKKLKRLEESCEAATHLGNEAVRPKRNHCMDQEGNKRINNEVWSPDVCTKCECRHAQISCTRDKCVQPDCGEGFESHIPAEACCAQCVQVDIKKNAVEVEKPIKN